MSIFSIKSLSFIARTPLQQAHEAAEYLAVLLLKLLSKAFQLAVLDPARGVAALGLEILLVAERVFNIQ